jgi:hypothetical protein
LFEEGEGRIISSKPQHTDCRMMSAKRRTIIGSKTVLGLHLLKP